MSGSAAKLTVAATLDGRDASQALVRGLDRISEKGKAANKTLRAINESGGRIAAGVGAGIMAAGAAMVGTVAAAFRFADTWSASIDELAKFGREVRSTVPRLQALQYATSLEGVSADALRDSLRGLNTVIGQLAAGRGKAYAFFSGLRGGRDLIRDLTRATDTVDALMVSIDALRRVKPEYRGAIARALGLSPEALRLIDAGADGIRRLMDERARYGLVSEAEARRAEEYNDAMTRLRTALDGLRSVAGVALIDSLRPYLDRLTEWIEDNRQRIPEIIRGAVEGVRGLIEAAIPTMRALADIIREASGLRRAARGLPTDRPDTLHGPDQLAAYQAARDRGLSHDEAVREAQSYEREVRATEIANRAALQRGGPLTPRPTVAPLEVRGGIRLEVSAAPGLRAAVDADVTGVPLLLGMSLPPLGGEP